MYSACADTFLKLINIKLSIKINIHKKLQAMQYLRQVISSLQIPLIVRILPRRY